MRAWRQRACRLNSLSCLLYAGRMMCGAVVFMDALGFKGIWSEKKWSPEDVIKKLKRLRDVGESKVSELVTEFREKGDRRIDAQVALLSDTVVIGVSLASLGKNTVRGDGSEWTLFCAGVAAAAIVLEAAETDPPLAFRGVLAFGEFLMDDRFLIGRGID